MAANTCPGRFDPLCLLNSEHGCTVTSRSIVTNKALATLGRVAPPRTMRANPSTGFRPFSIRRGRVHRGAKTSSHRVRRPYQEGVETNTALNTTLTRQAASKKRPTRRTWRLAAGVVVASGILVIPNLVTGPNGQSNLSLIVEALACAIVVGIGRQGIDVLALRLVATGVAVPFGWVAGGEAVHLAPLCPALQQCDLLWVGLVSLGLLLALILAIVSIPTSIMWNRGLAKMKPEIVLAPRTWWHWAIIVGAMALFVAAFVVAFPAPT